MKVWCCHWDTVEITPSKPADCQLVRDYQQVGNQAYIDKSEN